MRQILSAGAQTLIFTLALTLVPGAKAQTAASDNATVLVSPKWTPTAEQTSKSLEAVRRHLADAGGENAKRILKSFDGYRVQFSGETQNGCRLIWCNFFPAPPEGQFDADRHPEWKTKKVEASGDEEDVWHIYYDPQIDACMGFSAEAGK